MWGELRDTLIERDRAAAGGAALALVFRATTERAEPAEIAVGARLDQEDIQLVTDDANAGPRFIRRAQGAIGGAAQFAEAALCIEPKRQVQIAALVPDLDAPLAEFAKPRDLLALATEPITATARTSANCIQASVTTSAAMRN